MPLITTKTIKTDGGGNFNITDDYPCPTPGTLVYLVASGGNPGLPGNVDNPELTLMSAIGTCATLQATAFITLNELTTVASVEALAPFMADVTHVGSDASNTGGLAGAFATASAMVNFSTGQPQTPATGATLPTALLNTLANILSACVNTSGDTTAGTNCANLQMYTGTSTDTISAMLSMVHSPAQNVTQLFGLIDAQAPFSPALVTAPADFGTSLSFPLATGAGYLMAIDSAQHIWIYVEPPASGTSTYVTEPITVYDNSGNLLFTIPPGSGGLDLPVQIVSDPFGNVWALNSTLTLSKFDGSGNAISPPAGYPIPLVPPAGATPTSYFGSDLLSVDPSGNLWSINSGSTSNCFIEVNNSGTVITPSGNFCAAAGNTNTGFSVADGSGDAWFSGFQTLSKVDPTGTLIASGVNTNGCFYETTDTLPTGSISQDLASEYVAEGITTHLLYDRFNNQLWGTTEVGVGALQADGSQVFCHSRGADLPLIPAYNTQTQGSANSVAGLLYINASALDGKGNLWFTTIGYASNEVNYKVTSVVLGGLNSLNSSGALTTSTGVVSGGYSYVDGAIDTPFPDPNAMAIDGYGNIWVITGSNVSAANPTPVSFFLTKIPGLAAPKTYQ